MPTTRSSQRAKHSSQPDTSAKRDNTSKEIPKEGQPQTSGGVGRNEESTTENDKREADISSSILENGIIYFFFRGRVGVEEPEGIQDVARSYIVLRPLPTGAKIAENNLDDTRKARLLVLPKQMLPKKHGDGFLALVEKSASSIKDLRKEFSGTEYATKTSGTSNIPAATPFAEGVYEITFTGQQSHLAYKTIFPEIGEVQNELGVHGKGGYIVSVKNPEFPGPGNVTIGHPPAYPESIQKKFRGLRWIPLVPELLDYDNTQLLVIGEELDVVGKSADGVSEDQKSGKKEALWSELDKQAHDARNHLKHCNRVFADLEESSKEYPKMQTTW